MTSAAFGRITRRSRNLVAAAGLGLWLGAGAICTGGISAMLTDIPSGSIEQRASHEPATSESSLRESRQIMELLAAASCSGGVPLDEVIITDELERRKLRPPDFEGESRALAALAQALVQVSGSPAQGTSGDILQRLAASAIELCRAHSAGISLIEKENGREVIRWRAVVGRWAKYAGSTMPRAFSPCGTVIDRDATLLMSCPGRHYELRTIDPPATEMLLLPFHCGGAAAGTLWIVAHDETRKFDAEDRRLVASLSRFAAAAYQVQIDREAKLRLAEQLEAELATAQHLHETSIQLIGEGDVDILYERILDAALSVMRSDCASIRMLQPERGSSGELLLLGHRGFDADLAKRWERACPTSHSISGAAMRTRHRVVVPDIQVLDSTEYSDDREIASLIGIHGIQSTPLLSRGGQVLGILSTHWRNPHQPAERDLQLLDVLARQAADLIERSRAEAALRESERRFRRMADTAPAILCVTEADGTCSFMSHRWSELTGQEEREALGLGWLAAVHPDDRDDTREEYLAANARGEPFSREHRVRRTDGAYRWMLCAGEPRRDGAAFCGYMVSIVDITGRKEAEESTKMLMREVTHRSKNLLSVVQAIARLTAYNDDPRMFAHRFGERLAGLAASQDLLVQNDWRGVEPAELIRSQLADFAGLAGSRILLRGPGVRFSPSAAQTIGMAVHELATNAGRYGALSDDSGSVVVTWEIIMGDGHPQFRMKWLESGGPLVQGAHRRGFGHTVLVRIVEEALDAQVSLEYAPGGLVWQVCAPAASVMNGPAEAIARDDGAATY